MLHSTNKHNLRELRCVVEVPSASETPLLSTAHFPKRTHAPTGASTLTLPLINGRVQARAHALIVSPLIWRGAAFRSRWLVHVSVATGATGLQQTSVLVMMGGGVGRRRCSRWRSVRGWEAEWVTAPVCS